MNISIKSDEGLFLVGMCLYSKNYLEKYYILKANYHAAHPIHTPVTEHQRISEQNKNINVWD